MDWVIQRTGDFRPVASINVEHFLRDSNNSLQKVIFDKYAY